MGNACATANTVPGLDGANTTEQQDLVDNNIVGVDGLESNAQAKTNAATNVHAAPAPAAESEIKEPTEVKKTEEREVEIQQPEVNQEEEKEKADANVEIILEKVHDQQDENNENKQKVPEYEFKRQLDSLKRAMDNASNLKSISADGEKLTQAIQSLELVIQILSLSHISTIYSREVKKDFLGLYGDLQMFRSFHLRFTLDKHYYKDISAIQDLSQFIQTAYLNQTKEGTTDYEGLLKEIQQGPSHDTFEEIRQRIALVRNAFNRVAGQNFSTLPNYLHVTFSSEPGFNLWITMFPNDFETSNVRFSEVYADLCKIDSKKILNIIALLDNANDQRVDIYQWMDFVKTNSAYLDKEGKISPEHIDQFSLQIESRAASMKAAPVTQTDNVYTFKSGIKYTGVLDQNFKRQGKGKLEDDEYEFEGEFLDDLSHGKGKETRKKVVYEGDFKNGLYDGQGQLVFPNGREYKGSFSQHQFSGYGELIGDDGIKYEGIWKNGQLLSGKITYHDGSFYEGEISQSSFKNGKGIMSSARFPVGAGGVGIQPKPSVYIDGTWLNDAPVNAKVFNFLETLIYDGQLDNWTISGKGKRTYVDGVYEGELLRDKRNNQGTLTYLNGDIFTGQWLEDLQVKGKFTYGKEKDHTYEGEWRNGQMEGKGKLTYSSGVYEGDVKGGKRSGNGVYNFTNGNCYEGQWVDNNQEGEGKFTYKEGGDIYSGQFSKGKFHGYGQYYYKSTGKQYLGEWDNDLWSGLGKFIDADHKVIKCGVWKNDKFESAKDEKEVVFPENLQHLLVKIEKPVVAVAPEQVHS